MNSGRTAWGRPPARRTHQRGITLIEMLVVVTLISLVIGISYPSVAAGLDSIRLSSASDSVASFMLSAVNRAERRQELMELAISRTENAIAAAGVNYQKRLDLPPGIVIAEIFPAVPAAEANLPRRYLLYPGGAPPRAGVRLANSRGGQRLISIDPITGIPRVERVEPK